MKKVLSLVLASLGGLSLLGGAFLLSGEKPTEVLAEGTGTSSYEWTEEIPDDEIYLALNNSNWTNGGVYAYFWGGGNPAQWMGVAASPDSETVNANGTTNLYVVDGYDRSSTNIILHVNGSEKYRWDWYDKNATLPEGGWDIFVQTAEDSFNGYKADSFVYREILVESPVQPNLHYWTELSDSDDYGTTWPGIQMEKVEDVYEYDLPEDLPEGYDLYRAVVRYVEGYETQGLIINSDGGESDKFFDWSAAPGYVFRYDGTTGLTWDDSATKRSAYEFLKEWRTLRKEHEGKQDDNHEDGEGSLLADLLDVDLQPYAEHQQDQSEVLQEGDDLLFGEDRPLVLE